MPVLKYFVMKTFKLNSQIFIICCALIASGASALVTRIGSDGREYLIEYVHKNTWFQAWHECARLNRQLLTIDSREKQDVINKVLEGAVINSTRYLWLGANDEFNSSGKADRHFFWSATGKQFTYANWDVHNPDDTRHCVLITTPNKRWSNWRCDDVCGFICEEKQLQLESSNKNPNNVSDVVQKFINDFDLKFQSLLKENMAQLNGQLENKLTDIIELNHEITKLGTDLSNQLKRTADELDAKFSEKQNLTYPPIVLIKQTG